MSKVKKTHFFLSLSHTPNNFPPFLHNQLHFHWLFFRLLRTLMTPFKNDLQTSMLLCQMISWLSFMKCCIFVKSHSWYVTTQMLKIWLGTWVFQICRYLWQNSNLLHSHTTTSWRQWRKWKSHCLRQSF